MKKSSFVFLGLAVFSILAVSGVAFANSGGEYNQVSEVKYEKQAESKVNLTINQEGKVQFSGAKFVSLNGSNINVTVSGLPLTLVTDSSTQISGVASLANMTVGDTISGKGSINASTGVITALYIRDESQSAQRITDLENQIKSLLEQLSKLQKEFKSLR